MTNKTVKVRIAIAIAPDGAYNAVGYTGWDGELTPMPDSELRSNVIEGLDRSVAMVHFATIEVPLPTPQELLGSVEPVLHEAEVVSSAVRPLPSSLD